MDLLMAFIDNVILPRQDRVLVYFTESSTISAYYDDNRDGVADRREIAWPGSDPAPLGK